MAKEKIGPGRRRGAAVAHTPRENATLALSALLAALLAAWPVAMLLRLAVRL